MSGLASWVPEETETRVGVYTNYDLGPITLLPETGAARRLREDKYLPWVRAGGPNECIHGYPDGIPCKRCDRAEVARLIDSSMVAQRNAMTAGLFSADRSGDMRLWTTPPAPILPWYRRTLAWLDNAWESCLGAVGLCRISRAHEHSEPYDD